MAIYQYRCDRDGIIDVRRPIGTAPLELPVRAVRAKRCVFFPRRCFRWRRGRW